jgi:hypothetical protein
MSNPTMEGIAAAIRQSRARLTAGEGYRLAKEVLYLWRAAQSGDKTAMPPTEHVRQVFARAWAYGHRRGVPQGHTTTATAVAMAAQRAADELATVSAPGHQYVASCVATISRTAQRVGTAPSAVRDTGPAPTAYR